MEEVSFWGPGEAGRLYQICGSRSLSAVTSFSYVRLSLSLFPLSLTRYDTVSWGRLGVLFGTTGFTQRICAVALDAAMKYISLLLISRYLLLKMRLLLCKYVFCESDVLGLFLPSARAISSRRQISWKVCCKRRIHIQRMVFLEREAERRVPPLVLEPRTCYIFLCVSEEEAVIDG